MASSLFADRCQSQLLSSVQPSATVALTALAAQRKAEGQDIIALGAGEPDFNTPQHIQDAALAAMQAGHTRYTTADGIAELKAAICSKFERENGLSYAPENISVGTGGKQVLFNALVATLNPGDEVIVPSPYWVSYPDIARLGQATPVIVPGSLEQGFKITAAQLAAAITDNTKWFIFNSPSNPSGAVYSRAEIDALAEVVRAHPHVGWLCDDIYEHIVYAPATFATPAQVAPDLIDRIFIVNGVSKSYAMTGWRIGYGAGPVHVINAMRKLQSQSTTNPCSISQYASLAALEGPQDYISESRAAFLRRRDQVCRDLDACPGLVCPVPDGAFYVYVSLAGCLGKRSAGGALIDSDEAFVKALLNEHGVAIVHGAAFGLSPCFRLSYAAADDTLVEACRRIRAFCDGLHAYG
ncbi:MAG: pyridoxal phosphate-dependent aminotransferase [Pseudomonadota bacterium]